jgi:hypothetical protein
MYAQLSIPTNIDNAVQTIRTIILTSDGTSSGQNYAVFNSGGNSPTLLVSGSIVA